MNRKKRSLESILLTSLKKGRYFYTNKQDKDITAIAGYYNIKVTTERLIILNPVTLKCCRVCKVKLI